MQIIEGRRETPLSAGGASPRSREETLVATFLWDEACASADISNFKRLHCRVYRESFWDVVGNEAIRSVVELLQAEGLPGQRHLCYLVPNRAASAGVQYSWDVLRRLLERRSCGNWRYLLVDGAGCELNLGIPSLTSSKWQERIRKELNANVWEFVHPFA